MRLCLNCGSAPATHWLHPLGESGLEALPAVHDWQPRHYCAGCAHSIAAMRSPAPAQMRFA